MRRSGIFLAIALVFFSSMCVSAQTAPAAKTAAQAEKSDKGHDEEGCKLLPYTGTIPLSKLPFYVAGQPDFRGGVVCHYRISPDLPLFTFHFAGKSDNSLGDLEITKEPGSTIVQTIEAGDWGMVTSASELEDNLLTPGDANFDGYEDLQIMSNCGATGNCAYYFYIYDPSTKQFVHNEFLSNNLCSPEFHEDTKQITTHSNGSVSDWENDTYQYADGHYTLIRQEISAWDRKTEKVTVNTYELRNGKMELVNSEKDPQ